jgi:hypothetical protein
MRKKIDVFAIPLISRENLSNTNIPQNIANLMFSKYLNLNIG